MTSESSALLTLESVTRRFGGHRAVDAVSFSVRAGTITGLIGPNGAGKTTVFNLIAGTLKPSAGTIALGARRLDGEPPHRVLRAGVARTFQIPRPFAAMTVLENVMLAGQDQPGERFWTNWLHPAAVAAGERALRERARELLDFVGLDRLSGAPARVLSGGQRKLLELARALMTAPRLLLLDEPAAGVNPALLEAIAERIVALNREGVTVLIIEHNLDLVMRLCRPVLVMASGRLLLEGDPETVRADPRVLEAYLGGTR
ncbi:MAG TPA: ABC transporter ATP-binding protein [Methylomirabilota bacterium]|jgi:branched-chain amino acid transport system ATP-binding protein|nr:ABC transporter ATP-binding protein [Methylomirabilota bacterium]